MPRVPRVPRTQTKGQPIIPKPAVERLEYIPPPRETNKAPLYPLTGGRTAADSARKITRWRSFALTCACLTGGATAFYCVSLYISTTRAPHASCTGPTTQAELTKVYDRTASSFDADVGVTERLTGITRVRKALVGQCRGDVLEVSSGTARNLGYYRFGSQGQGIVNEGVKSLTLVDLSESMVEEGKRKWDVLKATAGVRGADNVPVRFFKGDAGRKLPLPPPQAALVDDKTVGQKTRGVQDTQQTQQVQLARMNERPKGYDVVVQTMGLCSTDAPVELLRNIASYLDPANPDARILLLEHGRSHYDWWNRILDNQAPVHADKHGCWWNRDIGDIVKQSGLEIVRERRQNFGTTWIFELKPDRKAFEVEQKVQSETTKEITSIQQASMWESWLPRWTYEKICKR